MKQRIIGMKIYTPEWFLRYGLSYDEAAARLRDLGVDLVIVYNQIMPLPDSAVQSQPSAADRERWTAYSDRAFRDAIGAAGIRYYANGNMFFDPDDLARWPQLHPIDERGLPMEQIGWYAGLCPSQPDYIAHKIGLIERMTRELAPDGIFLGFMRFPGFWELWMPSMPRSTIHEGCFCPTCLRRFREESGIRLLATSAVDAAQHILTYHRTAWTDWKCAVIADISARARAAANAMRPGTQVMLNTVPFLPDDWNNAGEEILAQRIELLAQSVDTFELMCYHQILRRDATWPALVADTIKARSDRQVLATLQVQAEYLEPIYAGQGRTPEITLPEFQAALDALANSQADGVVFFLWKDFLQKEIEERDTRWADAVHFWRRQQ